MMEKGLGLFAFFQSEKIDPPAKEIAQKLVSIHNRMFYEKSLKKKGKKKKYKQKKDNQISELEVELI